MNRAFRLIAALLLTGCTSGPSPGDAQNLDFWSKLPRRESIEERIFTETPDELRALLRAFDMMRGGSPDLTPVTDPAFLKDVRDAIKGMPKEVRNLIEPRLLAIFVLRNIKASAQTLPLWGSDRRPEKAVVIINASQFYDFDANDGEGGREMSIIPLAGTINITLERPENNNRVQALQYVLLHEFGHVAAMKSNTMPWDMLEELREKGRKWPFRELSWDISTGNKYISLFDDVLPERMKIALSRNAVVSLQTDRLDALDIYRKLEKTSLVSIYSTVSPAEDFAESFAQYVHVVRQKRPYKVEVAKPGEHSVMFEACMSQTRCSAKRKLFEGVF